MDEDYGIKAQRAGELRLDACREWLDQEESGEAHPDDVDPSCGAFCGCLTCEVREVLEAAWPILAEGIKQEALRRLALGESLD